MLNVKHLLSEGSIGNLTIRNRLIMPAMSETLTDKYGQYMEDERAYYQERAKGGTGLIITSFCAVDPKGLGAPNQLGAYDLSQVVGLKKISDSVHRYGGHVFLQLHHAGRAADPKVIGEQPIAPSAIACPLDIGGELETPREMTKQEIEEIVNKFVFSATIAKKANFDGVELHCAHSYLLNQFISPLSNRRSDEYGGTTENRVRVLKEIIKGIKNECGNNYPISVRLSGNDGIEGGVDLQEAVKISKLLESYGIHLLNISAGGYEATQLCIPTAGFKEGTNVPLGKEIKKNVNIPVAVAGMIRDFEYASKLIENGIVDYVCMGRPHIADPYIISKLSDGREDEIRQCLTCMNCVESADNGRMACAFNPVLGYEKDFQDIKVNGNGKKVLIVGAGPSGCEAARVLALRGYSVVVLEKKSKLGGQVNFAAVPHNKYRMNELSKYYSNILSKLNVEILYNIEANIQIIEELDPHAVIVATGSNPFIPNVKGIDSELVYTAEYVLENRINFKGMNILIVGSGNTGIETAEYLMDYAKITIVDIVEEIGANASVSGMYTLRDVLNSGVEILSGHKLVSISEASVVLECQRDKSFVEMKFDRIVLAMGVRSEMKMINELHDKSYIVSVIGDSKQIGNISSAVKDGFYAGYYLENKGFEIV